MFLRARLMWRAAFALRSANDMIARLQQDRDATELAYMRISRDLIEQFLIALDQPERADEFRHSLHQSLGFYRDEIAVREEHVR